MQVTCAMHASWHSASVVCLVTVKVPRAPDAVLQKPSPSNVNCWPEMGVLVDGLGAGVPAGGDGVGGTGVGAEVGVKTKSPMNKSLFGDPRLSPTLFVCADSTMRRSTSSGFIVGSADNSRAATPDTCGHDMEVPLKIATAKSLREDAEKISEPGAKMSMQFPMLLKLDRRSSRLVIDPTVIACGMFAGAYAHASGSEVRPLFPAATTTVTPARFAASMAIASDRDWQGLLHPRLMLMTAGLLSWAATKLIA